MFCSMITDIIGLKNHTWKDWLRKNSTHILISISCFIWLPPIQKLQKPFGKIFLETHKEKYEKYTLSVLSKSVVMITIIRWSKTSKHIKCNRNGFVCKTLPRVHRYYTMILWKDMENSTLILARVHRSDGRHKSIFNGLYARHEII